MSTSRYQSVGTATLVSTTGEHILYLRRRFLPAVDESSAARPHLVRVGELHRPDLIAAAELGQPELSWVLADANPVMRPSELCAQVGQIVRVPQALGLTIGGPNAQ
jgi:hypothetical protein